MSADHHQFQPGDQILFNGTPAEVIKTYSVGDLDYLRAYVEDAGVKTVCVDDVEIEAKPNQIGALDPANADRLHPDHEAVSAEWFDLRSQAHRLKIAHEQGQLLSISNSLVRLEPYQLAAVNWVMQKLRQRALIADDVGLGKTIEAGLILKELAQVGAVDYVTFAPAGRSVEDLSRSEILSALRKKALYDEVAEHPSPHEYLTPGTTTEPDPSPDGTEPADSATDDDATSVEMKHFRTALESVRPTITEDLLEYYDEIEDEFRGGSAQKRDRTGGRIGFQ